MECRLSPPIVPLLDVLFVLLLFLMLNVDLGPREHEPILVPKARNTIDCTKGLTPTCLTVNVHHRDDRTCPSHARDRRCEEEGHWTVSVHGSDCSDPHDLENALRRVAGKYSYRINPVTEQRVIVRSDANAPYGLAQQAIDTCTRLGFRKIDVATRCFRGND
jgi:biopolymer transport protein ExbD